MGDLWPTLGGLKKLEEVFLKGDYGLPIFWMFPYGDVSLDDAITQHGAHCPVMNVGFTNEKGDKFLEFSELRYCNSIIALDYKVIQLDFAVSCSPKDLKLQGRFFAKLKDRITLLELARWGKPNPSWMDRWGFFFSPKKYFAKLLKISEPHIAHIA